MTTNNAINVATGATSTVLTGQGAGSTPTFSGTPTVTSITFGAGSALSTYTAAATWTPALSFGGGTTGITYTTQLGKYYQIGSVVFFDIFILLSSKGSSTGSAAITLPSTAANDGHFNAFSVAFGGSIGNFPTSTTQILGYTQPNQASMIIWAQGSSTLSNVSNTFFTNTSQVQAAGFYWTA